MALDLGGIFKTGSQILGGNQNQYFQTASNVLGLASALTPAKTGPAMAARPLLTPALRGGAMVGRTFFQRFPNLANSLQQLRNRGMNVKRSQLYRMLRRFGPELLVTGGLLTAAGVNELMLAGPGHRRMNAANGKALKRAARRIKAFHSLCGTADLLKTRSRRPGSKCTSCSKNPCRC